MKEGLVDQLKIKVYQNREQLGKDAAALVAQKITELLKTKKQVNMIFAAAASQNEFLDYLALQKVEWQRVNAFHMDEYIGLRSQSTQLFGYFLHEKIFGKVPFKEVFYLDGDAKDPKGECRRYTLLLNQYKPDITCMGIGENTHLAFNDPHVANFKDPELVKIVDIDQISKQQQVNEGCFTDVDEVPSFAYTLTIPALLSAEAIYCMVPGDKKAEAVYHTLIEKVTEKYPSTILRNLPKAQLFLDQESSKKVVSYPFWHHIQSN